MNQMKQIAILPYRKVILIAVRGMRFRMVKTFLVTCCIALALTFLTYIVCTNAMTAHVVDLGSEALKQRLAREGLLEQVSSASQRSQTAWMLGIALLISFVGIVNAMLISVTERFREIGTMKCLGGLDSFIVKLYLIESLFQGMIGTLLGIAVGVVLTFVEGLNRFGSDAWTLLPGLELAKLSAIAFLTGIVLTVAGALYPAWRAAKMEPVDAMRSEV